MPDSLSHVLAALEVSASVVLHHTYRTPWSLEVPSSDELAVITDAPPDEQVVAFHWAQHGTFRLAADGRSFDVQPAELVVCFGGVRHRMTRGETGATVGLDDLLRGAAGVPDGDVAAGDTRLLCGVFRLRNARLNPLVGAFPALLHARVGDPTLAPLAELVGGELARGEASSFILARALEILCAGVLRQHLRTEPSQPGLLRTLTDPRLGAALEAIHADPAAPWTLNALAKRAGLSRSRFSARFTELAGEPVMTYLTRWRMNVALRLLRGSERSVAEVASAVGYESVPAFSRTFKRMVGEPPARFRRRMAA